MRTYSSTKKIITATSTPPGELTWNSTKKNTNTAGILCSKERNITRHQLRSGYQYAGSSPCTQEELEGQRTGQRKESSEKIQEVSS